MAYGLLFTIAGVTFCLGWDLLFMNERDKKLVLCPQVKGIIDRVVILFYSGSTCTGTLLDDSQTVLTVRHLFGGSVPPLYTPVTVRKFPYHLPETVYLTYFHPHLDVAILSPHRDNTPIPRLPASVPSMTCQDVLAIGFGRESYSEHLFGEFELLLPTVRRGVVSKEIRHRDSVFYFKTDLDLYNGFSGCAVWAGQAMVGMAVFILKSAIDHRNHHRHNFSLALSQIQHYLTNPSVPQETLTFLQEMDAVTTRRVIRIVSKL